MATSVLPGTTRSSGHARTYKLGAGLRMRGATSGTVGILPPATITDYDLTLPGALGASDKLLQVSSAGVISLVDPVTIAGTGTELLYRGGASSAAAVAGTSWDGTTLVLPRVSIASNTWTFSSGTILKANRDSRIVWSDGTLEIGSSANVWMRFQHDQPRVYFGNSIFALAPKSATLIGTGGSGSNVVGGSIYIAPGLSTGNATPAAVILQSTVAGSSGSTAQTLADTLTVTNNLVRLAATTYQYWGPEGTDGSWRIGRSDNDIVIERRESGAWVTKSTITA